MDNLLESVFDVLEAYAFTVTLQRPDPAFVMAWRARSDGRDQFLYCYSPDSAQELAVHVLLPFRVVGAHASAVDEYLKGLNGRMAGVLFCRRQPSGLMDCRARARICAGRTGLVQIDQLLFSCLNAADKYREDLQAAVLNGPEV